MNGLFRYRVSIDFGNSLLARKRENVECPPLIRKQLSLWANLFVLSGWVEKSKERAEAGGGRSKVNEVIQEQEEKQDHELEYE